ncbi:MAG: CHAT domain-containing protein [Candidatus Korobacteraceae bacterium]|jgi:hypothetical protein
MDFLPTLPSYGSDLCAQTVWSWYEELLREQEGTAYYKHPIVGTSGAAQPDLTILTRLNHPIVVKIVSTEIDSLLEVGDERWTIQRGDQEEEILAPDAEILAAGASSAVVSLWHVSDNSTAVLMQEFYRNVLKGMPKAAALAAARATLFTQSPPYDNPFFWAPFVLTGE